jgi:hypothetical protein
MNSCSGAFGVEEGGGGNESVGEMFRKVLNATWALALVVEKGLSLQQWFSVRSGGWDQEEMDVPWR